MEYEKLIEGNYNDFINDLKVAFFDVTARNQAIMDQIEIALSHENDQDRINSLQTLWADYHDAVKGCISGANMIAASVEQLEKCSSIFEMLLHKDSAREAELENEEFHEIQEPVVELPEKAIMDISEEAQVSSKEDAVIPVEEEEVEDAVEATVPPIETEVVPTQKENIVPVVVEAELPDPTEAAVTAPVPKPAVTASTPAIVEAVPVTTPEVVPVVTASEVVKEPVPVVADVKTPAIVEATPVSKPEIVSTVTPAPMVVPTPVIEVAPISEVPVIASSVEVAMTPTSTEPTIVAQVPVADTQTIPAVSEKEEAATPMITATEAVEVPSIVSSTPVPEVPATTEPTLAVIPEVAKVTAIESPTIPEVTTDIVQKTDQVVDQVKPALVLEPVSEEVPRIESDPKEKVAEAPGVLLPTIEEVEKDSKEKKEGIVIPFPQEKVAEEEPAPEDKKLGVLDLEPVEESHSSAEVKDLLTFVKKSNLEDKAILVTKNQAQKLRYSKDLQSALIRSIHPTSVESTETEKVTEAELEDMMNQLSSLYEQGKMEEAEKMSEKISVLSKQLKLAA